MGIYKHMSTKLAEIHKEKNKHIVELTDSTTIKYRLTEK